MNRVQIISDKNQRSLKIKSAIQKKINQNKIKRSNITIVIGGDGFMLQTLHLCQNFRAPVYGMNRGTVGFMMNAYETDALPLRLSNAEEQIINPLIMKATLVDGKVETALAINEVNSDTSFTGALGQTRTGTPKRARILSPLCLPISPRGHC